MCHVRLFRAEGDGYGIGRTHKGIRNTDCPSRLLYPGQSDGIVRDENNRRVLHTKIRVFVMTVFSAALLSNVSLGDTLSHNIYIEQTPLNGGTVAPGTGIMQVNDRQRIRLRATPKPGYRFVYWLGLDGDQQTVTENETDTVVDSAMIIIAVFTREPYSFGRGTMLHPSPPLIVTSGYAPTFADPDDPHKKVPEPSSIILLAVGGIVLFRKTAKH